MKNGKFEADGRNTSDHTVVGCYCCKNSTTNPRLEPSFDLSYSGIGNIDNHYSMDIKTGGGSSTDIVIWKWNETAKTNQIIGRYTPKFCPECGRELTENTNIGGKK